MYIYLFIFFYYIFECLFNNILYLGSLYLYLIISLFILNYIASIDKSDYYRKYIKLYKLMC